MTTYTPFARLLSTPRLFLIHAAPQDIPLRAELLNELYAPYTPKRWTSGSIQALIDLQSKNHIQAAPPGLPSYTYIIRLRPTPSTEVTDSAECIRIGNISFSCKQASTPPEIGFAILKAHQGKGYVTEAIRAIVAEITDHVGVKEVCALTSKENVACQKALVKAGFVEGGWVVMDGIDDEGREMRAFVLEGMKKLAGERTIFVASGVLEGWTEDENVQERT